MNCIKLLIALIIAASTLTASATKINFPIVKGKYIQIEDIRAIIFNGIDGLNLYNQLTSGKGCINAIDSYVTDIELMLDSLIEAFGFQPRNR